MPVGRPSRHQETFHTDPVYGGCDEKYAILITSTILCTPGIREGNCSAWLALPQAFSYTLNNRVVTLGMRGIRMSNRHLCFQLPRPNYLMTLLRQDLMDSPSLYNTRLRQSDEVVISR